MVQDMVHHALKKSTSGKKRDKEDNFNIKEFELMHLSSESESE